MIFFQACPQSSFYSAHDLFVWFLRRIFSADRNWGRWRVLEAASSSVGSRGGSVVPEISAASQGGGCSLCSAGSAPALLILLGSMGKCCAQINGEVCSSHRAVTLNKSSRKSETQSGDFLQSTSCYRRSYRRLNSHFCWCQLRCKAAGQVGAIKKLLHPLPGLPRVFAECQVQPALLEQRSLALILMMLGFVSKAQEVVLLWMLKKKTSELRNRVHAKLQE